MYLYHEAQFIKFHLHKTQTHSYSVFPFAKSTRLLRHEFRLHSNGHRQTTATANYSTKQNCREKNLSIATHIKSQNHKNIGSSNQPIHQNSIINWRERERERNPPLKIVSISQTIYKMEQNTETINESHRDHTAGRNLQHLPEDKKKITIYNQNDKTLKPKQE